MKALALRMFLKYVKYIGIKRAIRLGWRHVLYPRLLAEAKKSPEDWDDKTLDFVNKNIYTILNAW